jgi:trk system potassium uptake protein TrkH|tara:strand:+ start:7821 stop:9272 length:1452 start_codon:yes stop_codon:yes gene_type:complete
LFDTRPIFLVNGIFLAMIGAAMFLPALVDVAVGNDDWVVFASSAMLTLFTGVSFALMTWGHAGSLSIREAFVLVVAAWTILPAFAALPFAFSGLELSYADAFFEAMSGLTTTGSTVISGLDTAPPGILLWRSLLQWLGGLGIIVMAIAILPILQVGGMQLFKVEAFDTAEKVLPSAAQLAVSLISFYAFATGLTALLLWVADMPAFDAINHAMTSIATGGFSTKDGSVGFFASAQIDWIIIGAMIVGSLPFALYLQAIRGRPQTLWKDTQVQVFFGVSILFVALMTFYDKATLVEPDALTDLRYAAFNVISIMTGTGYATQDYSLWGPFATTLFFFIMFIGGCAGSTSCGIKIFRFQVVYEAVAVQVKRLIHPNGVFVPHYNGKPIQDSVTASVMSFMFLFALTFGVAAMALTLMGLDLVTAVSSAGTAIANVGPGLGPVVGPSGNFSTLPDLAKWTLSFTMLIGRLEIFTVLVILTPTFWRG